MPSRSRTCSSWRGDPCETLSESQHFAVVMPKSDRWPQPRSFEAFFIWICMLLSVLGSLSALLKSGPAPHARRPKSQSLHMPFHFLPQPPSEADEPMATEAQSPSQEMPAVRSGA